MPKLQQKTLVGIKSEASQNAGATLSNTDFIWVSDASIDTKVELLQRDYSRQYLEPIPAIAGKRSVSVKFKSELKGSGTSTLVDTPLRAALEACGLSAIISQTSSSAFKTSSDVQTGFYGPGKSAYIEVWKDGIKHPISGSNGTLKINIEASKFPTIEFSFDGLYGAPSDATMPSATPNTINAPICQLVSVGINNWTNSVPAKIEVDLGSKVVERPDITATGGLTGFMITGYTPKGSFDPEVVNVSTEDTMAKLTNGVTGAMSAVVGNTVGNRVTVSAACIQYTDAGFANRNDILTYNIPFNIASYAGGDFCIKFS